MRRRIALAATLAALTVAGCSSEPTGPGPRVLDQANMDAYVAAALDLYREDPTYGWVYQNPDESALMNFRASGVAMCEAMIRGAAPLDAYAVAYPEVTAAGNVGQLEKLHGQVAADTLCPTT